VDAVRLPKEIYFTFRVMQNEQPDIHILGHWSYPAKNVKTIYVIANTQSVELFVNGKSHGVNSQPANGYVFAFPDVEFAPGSLKSHRKERRQVSGAGGTDHGRPAGAIKLTLIAGPDGLQADGQDAAPD